MTCHQLLHTHLAPWTCPDSVRFFTYVLNTAKIEHIENLHTLLKVGHLIWFKSVWVSTKTEVRNFYEYFFEKNSWPSYVIIFDFFFPLWIVAYWTFLRGIESTSRATPSLQSGNEFISIEKKVEAYLESAKKDFASWESPGSVWSLLSCLGKDFF